MKRCCNCRGRMGLGIKSKRMWEPTDWGFITFQFCSQKCLDFFMQSRQASIDRRKAVAELYRRPP